MAFLYSTRLQRGPANEGVLVVHAAAAGDIVIVAPPHAAFLRAKHHELHTHRQAWNGPSHALWLLVHVDAQPAASVKPAHDREREKKMAAESSEASEARKLGDRGLFGV
eukprot:CAMPEP_0183523650 /NCGR_PEP_ID=MMETSP0371-20130417/19324_1 /TAXON_ID=268820 /ORGANISM="Peridinium aciculiferum, Strain PAER-2" /LENGTH=108 /DNA_ID=CAMNT_0025722627 /DNA_START=137 /DNA_END=463 /DNA_ORIENTATION=+